MRAVWSFWSKPFHARRACQWKTPLHHLLAWWTSVGAAARHYPHTMLVTDTAGKKLLVDQLGLPFVDVCTELDRIRHVDPGWWALGKILAYSLQDRPFVHLDADVFLWKPLPPTLIRSPVFTQYPEYGHNDNSMGSALEIERAFAEAGLRLPREWEWARSKWAPNFKEENCGIAGANHIPFYRYYSTLALDTVLRPEHAPAWAHLNDKHGFNYILEQFLLAACIEFHRFDPASPYRGITVRHLFTSYEQAIDPAHAASAGYTHLHGPAKSHPLVSQRLEARAKREDPAFYRRCVRLTDGPHLVHSGA